MRSVAPNSEQHALIAGTAANLARRSLSAQRVLLVWLSWGALVACSSAGASQGNGGAGGAGDGGSAATSGQAGAAGRGASAGTTSSGGAGTSTGGGGSGGITESAGSGGSTEHGGSGGRTENAGSGGSTENAGSGGKGGSSGGMGGGASTGKCLTDTAQLPAMKALADSDYYAQTSAAKGTITDVDFAWDASKNPSSGPPQHNQQAVSPEVPAGFERMQVYTPPGYDPNGTTRYPVLYLNHGTGDTYKVWLATSAGTGNVDRNPGYGARIYENLLDQHAAVPMIIVTAYIDDCGPLDAPSSANVKNDYGCTPKFKTAIIPKIDGAYRTIAERTGRAIAGLSRCGYVTLQTGLPNIDALFSEFYIYSAAYGASIAPDLTGYMQALGSVVSNSAQTNAWLNQPLYIAIGSTDTTVNGSGNTMNTAFVNAGVKTLHVVTDGGHEWGNWRRYLHQSLQIMFKNRNGCQ